MNLRKKFLHSQRFLFPSYQWPLSEAVCKSWGSLTDIIEKYELRSKDGADEEVGTNDKRVFVQINESPSGYKGTRKFLKATLSSMYGSEYFFHFRYLKCEMMKRFITSKVVNKINANASC